MPKPLTYEESLADFLERKKQMYVDPQYLPPEYDYDEVPDYALDEEDIINTILKELEITDYDYVEKIVNEPKMTTQKIRTFLNNKVLSLQSSGEIN